MKKLLFLILLAIPALTFAQREFDDGIQIVGGITVDNIYVSAGDTIISIAGHDFLLSDIRLKLNIADTAAMLATYINRSDTATMLLTYINRSDTAAMLSPYLLSGDIAGKLDIADTAAMLVPYINRADTAAMLVPYINRADTAAMLVPYINRTDTAAMLVPYINRTDTAAMLTPYALLVEAILPEDTAAMLTPYTLLSELTTWLDNLIPGLSNVDSLVEGGGIMRWYYPDRYYDVYAPVTEDTTNWFFAILGGDDANNGHSPATPKQTFPHLLTLDLDPGDTVFFNKGDTWRLTADGDMSWRGAKDSLITFTNYGSGDLPRILGSVAPISWTQDGGANRYWTVEAPDTFPKGRVFFHELDDSIKWGELETHRTAVDAVNEYYHSNDTTYVYSTSPPTTAFTSVEIPQVNRAVEIQTDPDSAEFYTFDGWEIAYFLREGISNDWPGGISATSSRQLRGLEVRNCLIHHLSYKNSANGYGVLARMSDVIIENNEIHNCGRRGVSVILDGDFYSDTLEDVLIQDNYFHDGWHTTGPDIINVGTDNIIKDIVIRRNRIAENVDKEAPNSGGIFIAEQGGGTAEISNVDINNNLITYVKGSGGIQIELVDSLYINNNTIYGTNNNGGTGIHITGTSDTSDIRNNIIYLNIANTTAIYSQVLTGYNVDYNLYYLESTSTDMWEVNSVAYDETEWAAYKAATGWDANSPTPADPLFKDPPTNLRVGSGSDAVGAGIDIVGYTHDYEGVAVSSPPNIGAIETTED